MKKIELKTLKMSVKDMLTREQMRSIIAGSSGGLCTANSAELGSLRVNCNQIPYYHLDRVMDKICCVPCPDPTSDCMDEA